MNTKSCMRVNPLRINDKNSIDAILKNTDYPAEDKKRIKAEWTLLHAEDLSIYDRAQAICDIANLYAFRNDIGKNGIEYHYYGNFKEAISYIGDCQYIKSNYTRKRISPFRPTIYIILSGLLLIMAYLLFFNKTAIFTPLIHLYAMFKGFMVNTIFGAVIAILFAIGMIILTESILWGVLIVAFVLSLDLFPFWGIILKILGIGCLALIYPIIGTYKKEKRLSDYRKRKLKETGAKDVEELNQIIETARKEYFEYIDTIIKVIEDQKAYSLDHSFNSIIALETTHDEEMFEEVIDDSKMILNLLLDYYQGARRRII